MRSCRCPGACLGRGGLCPLKGGWSFHGCRLPPLLIPLSLPTLGIHTRSPSENSVISLLGERACQNCSNRFSSWVATMIVLEPTVCLGGPSWGKLTGPILLAPSSLRSSFSMTMLVSFGGSPCTHSGFGKIVTFNFSP